MLEKLYNIHHFNSVKRMEHMSYKNIPSIFTIPLCVGAIYHLQHCHTTSKTEFAIPK